jgi:hypothetical protein
MKRKKKNTVLAGFTIAPITISGLIENLLPGERYFLLKICSIIFYSERSGYDGYS